METLFLKHDQFMMATPTDIVRDQINDINWKGRMLAIVGAKGVGKSTLIKQYIKLHYEAFDRSVLYCSLDSVYFATHTLIDLAAAFVMNGGKHLLVDEIHKYEGWSRELKEIYDLYPSLRIVISGSSMLDIIHADADLSRRCVRYEMKGLSFREFLRFYKNINIKRYTLKDILAHPSKLCLEVNAKCKPVQMFKEYLRSGYYPFYLDGEIDYYTKIEQVINYIIDAELPALRKVEVANLRKIRALVGIIAGSVPYELNANKLAAAIGAGRDTVIEYLKDLDDAGILNLLYSTGKYIGKLSRPDKVYAQNANILYALAQTEVNIGTARETFVVGQLNGLHTVEYGKTQGDFKVDGKITFEVGGKDKDFSQIADLPDSYILADDMETPVGHKLPIWVVGFLY